MGKCERILTLEEDEAKDGEEVDEDEREDEGEDDGPKVARDSADHILQRLLPEDHLHQLNNVCFMITVEGIKMETYQDGIEERVKDVSANTKDHEKYVVDQLPVLKDLKQGLVECAHVPYDGHKVDALEDDDSHSKEREGNLWTERDNHPGKGSHDGKLEGGGGGPGGENGKAGEQHCPDYGRGVQGGVRDLPVERVVGTNDTVDENGAGKDD